MEVGTRVGLPSKVGRTVGYVAVACLLIFGLVRCAQWVWLPHQGKRVVTDQWNVVSVAQDRRSAVIRVDVCAGTYSGATVRPTGRDVRITVYLRQRTGAQPGCVMFAGMPTYTVNFGARLPSGGRILGGCAANQCHS